jgi:hypothetical protein
LGGENSKFSAIKVCADAAEEQAIRIIAACFNIWCAYPRLHGLIFTSAS